MLMEILFLWIFTSFQVSSDVESKTCGFFGSILPNRKQPKKATQQAVQKVWNVSFKTHSFFSLDLIDFRTSKVIAFLTEVALLFSSLNFLIR